VYYACSGRRDLCAGTCISDRWQALVTSARPHAFGSELFLPLSPIARALGADVTAGQDQTIRVRRVDGTVVVYDGRTGDIRAGAVMVGQVKDYPRIRVVADLDQIAVSSVGYRGYVWRERAAR